MISPTADQASARLEAIFGPGHSWTSQEGSSATVWETPAYHLLWFDGKASETELRRLWEARKGRQAYPVVLLTPADDDSNIRVAELVVKERTAATAPARRSKRRAVDLALYIILHYIAYALHLLWCQAVGNEQVSLIGMVVLVWLPALALGVIASVTFAPALASPTQYASVGS